MNSLTLTMPRLGETMDEGVIVGWMVAPGEAFKRGQPILELETDKTVVEFPALGDGMLEETFASPGDRIEVGKPIARAKVFSEADWADENAAPAEATVAEEATPVSILRMPKLGETMDEGVISSWLVAEGAAYARGDAILEVETDKTVAEVPALYEGRLLRILAQPGEKLPVGAPIAEVEGRVEEVAGEAAVETAHATVPVPAIPRPGASSDRLRATPLARRLARQNGIALDQITGTGRRGRIERADVQRLSGVLLLPQAICNGCRPRWAEWPIPLRAPAVGCICWSTALRGMAVLGRNSRPPSRGQAIPLWRWICPAMARPRLKGRTWLPWLMP
ncbi:biotin/lipoyl-containing protein [Paracoccus aerius]